MLNPSILFVLSITVLNSFTVCSIDKEYVIVNIKANWHSAYMFCRAQNMTLLTIENATEQQNVSRKIVDGGYGYVESFWLSGTDQQSEGEWQWMSNGKSMRPYTNWGAGQPDNAGRIEHCAEIWTIQTIPFSWNDRPCNHQAYFLCEYHV